jgi:hypothetical protein
LIRTPKVEKKGFTVELRIAFTPAEVSLEASHPEDIYVVVDVIRATTSLLSRNSGKLVRSSGL